MTLRTRQLDITVPGRTLCHQLDWCLQPGEVWALLGLNGSGKTSLLHTLAGLREPAGGRIELNDRPVSDYAHRDRARQLGLLLQHQEDNFPLTVREGALNGCYPYLSAWASIPTELHQRIETVLARYQLTELAERDIGTLSGGERQRLALAILAVQSPRFWLLDEPTNHLDLPHQINTLAELRQQATRDEIGILMALHDINLAVRYATHVLVLLADGEWVQGPCDTTITAELLERLYGCRFDRLDDGRNGYWIPRQAAP